MRKPRASELQSIARANRRKKLRNRAKIDGKLMNRSRSFPFTIANPTPLSDGGVCANQEPLPMRRAKLGPKR